MPTEKFGVYPAEETAGTEVSSTYEGRHVTLVASEIVSPTGVVVKGDPVVFGTAGLQGVGVAFNSEVDATDLIAIDTEGIWNLPVVSEDDGGSIIVVGGDPLYINVTNCVISKIRDNATQIPFGYALGQVAEDEDAVIAVKVHWAPISHTLLDVEKLYFGDGADYTMQWNETFMAITASADSKIIGETFLIAAGALADGYGFKETNFNVSGQATGYVAGDSTWLNLEATFKAQLGGGLVTPHTDGIYMTADAEITGAVVALGGKFTDQMDESGFAWYTLWNLNLTQTFDALYEINNPALMGYLESQADTPIGSLPFFSTGVGAGITRYIMLYQNPAA